MANCLLLVVHACRPYRVLQRHRGDRPCRDLAGGWRALAPMSVRELGWPGARLS